MNNLLIYIIREELELIEAWTRKDRKIRPERALICKMTMDAMKSVCSYVLIVDEIENIDEDWRTFTLTTGEREFLKNVKKYVKAKKKGLINTKELREAVQDYISDLFWMELNWYENL